MKLTITAFMVSLALLLFAAEARAVNIDWVPVGNPGNRGYFFTSAHPGAVSYVYSIDKFDVTVLQYVEFLNTKDPTGANVLGLYNSSMSDDTLHGGIDFNNSNLPGSKYSAKTGHENHPVNYASFYDSIRFANWLNNGQGQGDTESGAYTLLHDGLPAPIPIPSNGASIVRQAGAKVFLPSENEWYKAAYYNPNVTYLDYYSFPTSSDWEPIASIPTALPNHVNANNIVGDLTDVGAYTGTASPYGMFDMDGNVFQWLDDPTRGPPDHFLRGSAYNGYSYEDATSAYSISPTFGGSDIGFRVAMIPEPSTGVLALVAVVGLLCYADRRLQSHDANTPPRQPISKAQSCWPICMKWSRSGE